MNYLLLACCLFTALVMTIGQDGKSPAERILFASCNRQSQPQSFWTTLKKIHPDAFVWTGDAVYAKDNSIEKLKEAYESLLENENYHDFALSTTVVGTWDDHGKK